RDYRGDGRLLSTPSQTFNDNTSFGPFGEPYPHSHLAGSDATGVGQDFNLSEYEFPARIYGIQGRGVAPDPAGFAAADPTDPQTWNRYSYVRNLPTSMVDPTGLDGDGGGFGGCGWCEQPPMPIGGGKSAPNISSHSPFPIPGQGIDWLNLLFGPACSGGPVGNPCINTFHIDPFGNGMGDRNGEEICGGNDYGEESCLYWNTSLGRWQRTDPTRPTERQMMGAAAKGAELAGRALPAVCGGGIFVSAGGGPLYGLVDLDSEDGLNSGGAFSAGRGAGVGGEATQTRHGLSGAPFLFLGEGAGVFS